MKQGLFSLAKGLSAASLALLSVTAYAADTYPYQARCPQEIDGFVDAWNFYGCECTSYVASKLDASGVSGFSNWYKGAHWGNAYLWETAASESSVSADTSPRVGDVAMWRKYSGGASSYGHVAYVESVNADGSVNISEYNWATRGGYGTRQNIRADLYIHVNSNSTPTTIVASGPTHGIDVSHHQGTIDWASVSADPDARFAYIKATEGSLPAGTPVATLISQKALDSQFSTNINAALDNGIFSGLYHFARPDLNPGTTGAKSEAQHFVRIAAPYYAAHALLPPALDVENTLSGSLVAQFTAQELSTWVQTWLETVHTELGVKPIIYTFADYSNYLTGLTAYDLWMARYPYSDGSFHGLNAGELPDTGNWSDWVLWQYTSAGAAYVDGINSSGLDRNVFRGTLVELQTWAGTAGGLIASGTDGATSRLPVSTVISPELYAALVPGATVNLSWNTDSRANTWRILISPDATFAFSEETRECSNCVVNAKTSEPNYSTNLDSGSYYVTVRAGHTTDLTLPASEWSTPHLFFVRLPAPQLQSPANNSSLSSLSSLTWTYSDKADTSRIQITQDADFVTDETGMECSNCVVNDKGGDGQYSLSETLAAGTYTWRVRVGREATNPSIPHSEWSANYHFTIAASSGNGGTTGGGTGTTTQDPWAGKTLMTPTSCPQSTYALFSMGNQTLNLPFIDVPEYNVLTNQPTGNSFTLTSNLSWDQGSRFYVQDLTAPSQASPAPRCNAIFNPADQSIYLPVVEVPTYSMMFGIMIETGGKDYYAAILKYSAAENALVLESAKQLPK